MFLAEKGSTLFGKTLVFCFQREEANIFLIKKVPFSLNIFHFPNTKGPVSEVHLFPLTHMSHGNFYLNPSDRPIFNIRGVWLVFFIIIFMATSEFNANSVDPDQTQHSAASDLDLLCFPMLLLWGARH